MAMWSNRISFRLALLVCVFAAATLWGGHYYWNSNLEKKFTEVVRAHKASYPDEAKERRLANKYWAKYQDVRDNSYFGKHGRLGIYGAREHYLRHGRKEFPGRIWPSLD